MAARHLANAGVEVVVTTTRDGDQLDPVPAHQFDILSRMGVEAVADCGAVAEAVDLIIDAVIGYSLRGAPKGRSAELIAQIMAARSAAGGLGLSVVSLDNPSGLNVTTGNGPALWSTPTPP